MNAPDPPRPDLESPETLAFGGPEQAERLVQVLDDYLARLKAGEPPDRSALLAAHPELAEQLNACLAGLEFIQAEEQQGSEPGVRPPRTLGDFLILREVGRGGMGAVYEAEQRSLGRRVALKVLRFGGFSDPEALERFRREAETVARLHHTNIVPIFAVGSDQGVNYYAMQYIEGRSLAEVGATATEPLDVTEVVGWGLQAAEALIHAHQRHVIHRDVKPSNLLLDHEGRIWLTDFGLARRLDDFTLSMTGGLLGTPRYMSPEQASAMRQRLDERTDIYSLGASLHELLAGRPAFSGETPHDVIQQILTCDPEPLRRVRPSVPRDLETVVMKCLAKQTTARYATAVALADDLRAVLDNRPIRARRAGPVERASRWIHRRRRSVGLVATVVAATLLAVVVGTTGWWAYEGWRSASVSLATTTPPLSAELRDAAGNLRAAVTVPTPQPLTVARGEYHLQFVRDGRFSQTLATTLERGQDATLNLESDDMMLWTSRTFDRAWTLVQDGDEARLLWMNDQGIELTNWRTQLTRWKVPLNESRPAKLAEERWPVCAAWRENLGISWAAISFPPPTSMATVSAICCK